MTLLTVFTAALLFFVIVLFNRLVRDRNQVATAWSDVDVQLQRRHDLVPQLVATVSAYAKHESQTFERVVSERNAAKQASDTSSRIKAETKLGADMQKLVLLAEAYPDLKASTVFIQLSSQLVDVENYLQSARRFYNGSVRQFNNRCQQFPHLLIAQLFAFKAATFFVVAADDDRQPVEVKLS